VSQALFNEIKKARERIDALEARVDALVDVIDMQRRDLENNYQRKRGPRAAEQEQ
jgi:tetrahydromethanopterin S-methyltransferase subunit B